MEMEWKTSSGELLTGSTCWSRFHIWKRMENQFQEIINRKYLLIPFPYMEKEWKNQFQEIERKYLRIIDKMKFWKNL